MLFISLIFLSSCDSLDISEANSLPEGTCFAKVEGYLNKTYTGQAIYENISTGFGNTLFFLCLQNVVKEEEDYRIVQFQRGDKPSAGTYSINNIIDSSVDERLFGSYSDSEIKEIFISTVGTIIIDDASGNRLKGSATYTALSNISLEGGESTTGNVKITVKFHAGEGSTGIIIN